MMHMHIKRWAQSLILFGPMKCADSKTKQNKTPHWQYGCSGQQLQSPDRTERKVEDQLITSIACLPGLPCELLSHLLLLNSAYVLVCI